MARGSILPRRLKNGEARYDVTIELPPVNGKRRQEYKTFKTKREAAAYLNARLGEIEKGVVVEKSKMTVADLMADYLNDARATTRPTTLASYEHTIRKHILPALGPVPVQKLTPLALKKFYANLDAQLCAAARGRRVLQLCHFHIRKALKEALRMGFVVRNVADSVTLPRGEDRKEQQTWTEEQARQFLAVAPQSTYGPLWAVMLATGMRRGEVLGLRWQDVDWENGVLYVRQSMVLLHGKPTLQAPKTKSSHRQVPAPPHVLAALREHKRRQNEQRLAHADLWQSRDLVFCTGIGTPINADNLKRDLARLATIAGVPRIRVHALRHTYATLAIADAEDGADMVAVSKNLGHARTSITMDIYSHALPQQRRDVVDKLGARLFRGAGDAVGEGR